MLLRLNFYCQQEQKLVMNQRQTLLVRCLIVYLRGHMAFVPIRPKVTTREAKKTGYEFAEVEIGLAEYGAALAAISAMAGELPPELKDIVYFMGHTLSAEWRP